MALRGADAVVFRTPRPVRGTAEETRARLISTAAEIFNRDGFGGTDSNRIAREAGYAPGTFYKHFKDKKALFLTVYERIADTECAAFSVVMAQGGRAEERAGKLVDLVLGHHTQWRTLRSSLRALVASSEDVRDRVRAKRRDQLRLMDQLRLLHGLHKRTAEQDALLLFTLERLCDAIADGETEALGLQRTTMLTSLREVVCTHLADVQKARRRR